VAITDKDTSMSSDRSEFYERYNRFVRESPQGILYCHTWWLDAVAPEAYQIVAVEDSGQLRAAWPLVWSVSGRRRQAIMPPLTQKLGVMFSPCEPKDGQRLSLESRLVEQLLTKLPSGAYIDQHFHENFTNWLPFYWNGFQQTTRYTYVLEDLSSLEHLWAGVRRQVRQMIKHARNSGVRVRETDDLEYFLRIEAMTFTRQGMRPPHNLALVQRIDDACVRNAGRKILICEGRDGRAHAGVYLVYDESCAATIMSGANEDLRSSGAGPLLHWELVEFASTVTKRFDFEGSMIRPIEHFYRGFGTLQVPYFRIWGSIQSPSSPGIGSFIRRARLKLATAIAP
jgi:Acetyltransferase (GNAT) domain